MNFSQLCGRLIITIVDLMQSHDVHVTSQTMIVYNELFDSACSSGITRLKNVTLSSVLNLREEEDQKTKQKTETIMEELRNVIMNN